MIEMTPADTAGLLARDPRCAACRHPRWAHASDRALCFDCRTATNWQPSPDWCNRYRRPGDQRTNRTASRAREALPHADNEGQCATCDVQWPCSIYAAALNAVRERSRDRDRTERDEAITHALAVGVPVLELGWATGLTRERIRQIGASA